MPRSLRRARGRVFHYTSAAGLLGIVQSQALWASEASSLNDLAEVRRGWDLIKEWLQPRQAASEAADWLYDFACNPVQAKHEVFVLSGTVASDDAAQWRLYGNGGKGYAVELAAAVQLAPITSAPESPKPKTGRVFGWYLGEVASVTPWYHVLYSQRDVELALEQLDLSFNREIAIIRRSSASFEEYSEKIDDLRGRAIEALGAIAHLTKEPGFSGEREVRVVTTYLFADQHIQYRPGPHGVISYGQVARSPKGHPTTRVLHRTGARGTKGLSLPIRSVRIGPLLSDEHTSTVERLLAHNNLRNVNVETSQVKLR